MKEETDKPEKNKRIIFYAQKEVGYPEDCDTYHYLFIFENGEVLAALYDGENIPRGKHHRIIRDESASNIGAKRADSLAQRLYNVLSEFPNPDEKTSSEDPEEYGSIGHRIEVTYKMQTQKIDWWSPPGETPKKIKPLEIELEKIYHEVTIK